MKNTIAILTIAFLTTNAAAGDNWQDPLARYDARKKMSDTISITWRTVDNVQQTCEAESRRRGHGGFGFGVEACSFWDGNQCTIITKSRPNNHEVGHEFRHCFQGNYH